MECLRTIALGFVVVLLECRAAFDENGVWHISNTAELTKAFQLILQRLFPYNISHVSKEKEK